MYIYKHTHTETHTHTSIYIRAYLAVDHLTRRHASLHLDNTPVPIVGGGARVVVRGVGVHAALDGDRAVWFGGAGNRRTGQNGPRRTHLTEQTNKQMGLGG